MKFDIITIFPSLIDAYFSEGVVARAKEKGLLSIRAHNLRDWTSDLHKTVDGRPFGGGPGMVLKFDPIYKSVQTLKSKVTSERSEGARLDSQSSERRATKGEREKLKVILTSVRGKRFTQKKAEEYSKLDKLIIICGRYEGVDERIAKYIADESISIGDYVLSGGEIPALAIIEATARLIPEVLGNEESPANALFPQYTRPEVFTSAEGKTWNVPKVLLTGNHKEIEAWRKKHGRNP